MNTESFLHQKKVRTMGTILAVVSCLSLLFCIVLLGLELMPGADSGPLPIELFEDREEGEGLKLEGVTDAQLTEAFRPHFEAAKADLPEGTTFEMYANTMIYSMRTEAGQDVPLPEGGIIEEYLDDQNPFLPEGISADTTVRELMVKDHAFFEANIGFYRLILVLTVLFYAAIAVIILRMALSWKREHPFGPGTVRGLRWLGIIFLVQFFGSFLIGPFLPYADYSDLLPYSVMYDLAVETLFTSGANLSCGIVFLTLSWVMEHGRNMKDEQSLTV